jgi:hypothetical protein
MATVQRLSQFIPEIWSAALLRTKEKSLVYGSLANRNYEGEITEGGCRVRISQVGDININTYSRNSTTALTLQILDDAQLYLDINQQKTFSFRVDDIDKAQAKIAFVTEAMRKAGYRLNDTADQYLAGLYGDCVISRNSSSSPVDMTSTNVENEFLMVGQLMDEYNAATEGRFAIIPPWSKTKILLAAERILTNNVEIVGNGYIGTAWGFDFYVSNNVNKDSTAWADSKIICGIKGETFTFAEQLLKMETYRMTDEGFGDVVKGLHVYGGRILQADVSACLFADYTAET